MATKRQEIRTKQRGEQDEESRQSSPQRHATGKAPQRGTTGGVQKRGQHDGRQRGILKETNAQRLARGLGWFSIGLGLAEVLAPRGVAKIAGVRGNHTGLIRLFGLREIASGIGIFMQRRPAEAVWSRVAGDALDLAALGVAFASRDSRKGRVAFATANVLGVTALDVLCAQQLSRHNGTAQGGTMHARHSLVINSSPEELYRFWRDFENLPRFMRHLESVKVLDDKRSHWAAKGPAGTTVEWDAEITEDRPNELIAWRSLEGADVYNTGSVRFEPAIGGRGTIVRVEIDYSPPGGVIGAGLAKLFGEEPEQQLDSDLRRFKQVIETGEVVRSEGSLEGTGVLAQRPAQPPSSGEISQ
jgi:uncharacterized membrane protein